MAMFDDDWSESSADSSCLCTSTEGTRAALQGCADSQLLPPGPEKWRLELSLSGAGDWGLGRDGTPLYCVSALSALGLGQGIRP